MGFCVVHMKKLKRGNIFGVGRHIFRENENYGNENVDLSKSHLDYDFVESDKSLRDRVFERISELGLKRKPRSDAVLLCSHVVTLSPEDVQRLGKDGCDEYFAQSYDFYCDRYGKENIVAAVVHWDETNPHMHIEHVPVTRDGDLSAKKLFSRVKEKDSEKVVRNDLEDLQTDFWQVVGQEFGLERGIPSTKKHLTERAFKQKKDKERQKEIAINEKIIDIVSTEEPEYFYELVDRVFEKPEKQTQRGEEQGEETKAKDEGQER